jgi:hypothetical protein
VAVGQSLGSVTNDFEDVQAPTISGCLKLLMQASQLIFAFDGGEYWLWNQRLWVPVSKSVHYCCRFFV